MKSVKIMESGGAQISQAALSFARIKVIYCPYFRIIYKAKILLYLLYRGFEAPESERGNKPRSYKMLWIFLTAACWQEKLSAAQNTSHKFTEEPSPVS
jgi:hypothetical protein